MGDRQIKRYFQYLISKDENNHVGYESVWSEHVTQPMGHS